MDRCVEIDEAIKEKFILWSKQNALTCGLLIGQRTLKNDYIVHAIKSDIKKCQGPMRELDEECLLEQSLTVTMMLPGGFWVLGLCIITSEELWNTANNHNKCKQMMMKLRESLATKKIFRGLNRSNQLILLQFNPPYQETVCWHYCYGNIYAEINPIDVSYKYLDKYFFEGKYSWNFISPYKEVHSTHLLIDQQQYWDQITKFEDQVFDSSLLLNGNAMPKEYEVFLDHVTMADSSTCDSSSGEDDDFEYRKKIKNISFDIFVCIYKSLYNYSNTLTEEQNLIKEKFYAHQESTVMEVCQAIKDDMVRSWASRLHFNIERLLESPYERSDSMKKVSVLFECSKVPLHFFILKSEPICANRLNNYIYTNLSLSKTDNYLLLDADQDSNEGPNKEDDCDEKLNISSPRMVEHFPEVLLYCAGIVIVLAVAFTQIFELRFL